METISEAKQHLKDNFDKGIHCPVCKQFVKKYVRGFNWAGAYGLILLYRHSKGEYVHIDNFFQEFGKSLPASVGKAFVGLVRHWDVIEQQSGERDDGSKRNGYWRITDRGAAFVKGEISMPSHVMLYNSTRLGFEGEYITISESLGKKFSYDELMAGLEYNRGPVKNWEEPQQVPLF